jgi:hypothetical protein
MHGGAASRSTLGFGNKNSIMSIRGSMGLPLNNKVPVIFNHRVSIGQTTATSKNPNDIVSRKNDIVIYQNGFVSSSTHVKKKISTAKQNLLPIVNRLQNLE